ncbi:MAG: hypothetical protein P1V97_28305, partial [Planctomycetota bacterium]|nr:hypothetical protein [Planctomycetota bacterium]
SAKRYLRLKQADAGTASAQDPDPRMVKRILKAAESIQKDVEKLRGLKFRANVQKGVQSREVMKKDVIGKMRKEFGSQKMRDGVMVLRTFGFVPKSFDFGEGLAQFYGSQIGGYYDPEAKRLFLIAGKGGGQAQEMNDQFVMAHELGHALQDQHFDLMRYNRLFDGHDDKTLAFKALVEGEATLVGFRWLGNKQPMLKQFSVKRFFEMNRRMAKQMPNANPNQKKLAALPDYLTENAMFPYEMGGHFVETLVNKRGFKAISDVFYNPPLSTEQILHPEKYMGPNKDYPLTVHMAKLNENLGEKKYRHVFRDTVGEWQTVLLLKALGVSEKEAYKAAAGWGGDRYQCFVHNKSKRTILVWMSVWDSSAEAKEFEATYKAALIKRYGKNHPWKLERRKSRVLLIDGANKKEAKKIARMSWESYVSRDSFRAFPELKVVPPLSDFGVKSATKPDGKKPKLYNTKPVAKGNGKTITEASTRTRFTLPNTNWKKIAEDVDVLRQFSRGRYADKKTKQELRFLELPLEYNEKTMARRLEGLLSQGARKVKRHGKKTMKIQGRSALKIDLEGTVPGEKDSSRLSILAVDYSESTLLFLFKAPPASWKAASADLDGIIGSLKLGRVLMADALKKGRRIECKGTVFSMIQPKGWKRSKTKESIVLKLAKAQNMTVQATHIEAPQKDISVEKFGRSIEASLKWNVRMYKKISSEVRDFSGQKAFILDYRKRVFKSAPLRVRRIAFLLSGGTELHITLTMPAAQWDEQLMDGLLDTIEILNPEAAAPFPALKNRNLDSKKSSGSKKKARLY